MKLIADTQIRHDGEDVAPGESFEVEKAKQADALIAAGHAHKEGEDSAAQGERKNPVDPDGQNGEFGNPDTNKAPPAPTTPGASEETLKAAGKSTGKGAKVI